MATSSIEENDERGNIEILSYSNRTLYIERDPWLKQWIYIYIN